jgi:hypothetical protein
MEIGLAGREPFGIPVRFAQKPQRRVRKGFGQDLNAYVAPELGVVRLIQNSNGSAGR